MALINGDPWENRTPVTTVKGRCLDRLTNEPLYGAGNRTRTYNLLITSQLLYQLSHTSLLRGYVLLSQAVAHQVTSALKSLTSVFGMGTGVSSLL